MLYIWMSISNVCLLDICIYIGQIINNEVYQYKLDLTEKPTSVTIARSKFQTLDDPAVGF
jgi:hypothetical protein